MTEPLEVESVPEELRPRRWNTTFPVYGTGDIKYRFYISPYCGVLTMNPDAHLSACQYCTSKLAEAVDAFNRKRGGK